MNERSSRSHTIFRITIESRETENDDAGDDYSESGGDGAVRVSTLNLVDLAGSESVRHTGATGERQKEGGMINQRYVHIRRHENNDSTKRAVVSEVNCIFPFCFSLDQSVDVVSCHCRPGNTKPDAH